MIFLKRAVGLPEKAFEEIWAGQGTKTLSLLICAIFAANISELHFQEKKKMVCFLYQQKRRHYEKRKKKGLDKRNYSMLNTP